MLGFDDKALILFPKEESWEFKDYGYKYQFKQALANLCRYLKSINIQPYAFYTDDVARDLGNPNIMWVSTLSKADRFFVKNHCGLDNVMSIPMVEYDEVYNEVTLKDPGDVDMSEDERFSMVIRHDIAAAKKIIPKYKIVVHFYVKNNAKYTVTSKQGDGRIRINVSAGNFMPTVYMSGNQEDPCDVLGVPFANRCLSLWYEGNEVNK